jgi:hypothetical protein
MLCNIIKIIVLCISLGASLLKADDCTIAVVEQTLETTTYQLCINLEQNIKLDMSSVCFESNCPELCIKSWRLINTSHSLAHTTAKKTLLFHITTTLPTSGSFPLIHAYFLELENKTPHHFTVPLNMHPEPAALPIIQSSNSPTNQDDYFLHQQKIKRGLIKVLKAPFTGIQYLTTLTIAIINIIFNSWILLFLIIMLLGFLMGFIPLFFPASIMTLMLNHSTANNVARLLASIGYASGFFAAMLLELNYYLTYHHSVENSVYFTLGGCAIFVVLALTLLGTTNMLRIIKIPSLAHIPIGLFMGSSSMALVLMGAHIMAPWFINFLQFVQQYHAIPLFALGLSLFLALVGWLSQQWIATISEPWLTELTYCGSIFFGFQALATLGTILPTLITGTLFVTALSTIAILYAWKSTEPTKSGIKHFRVTLSLAGLCAAFIIAAKLIIIALCSAL